MQVKNKAWIVNVMKCIGNNTKLRVGGQREGGLLKGNNIEMSSDLPVTSLSPVFHVFHFNYSPTHTRTQSVFSLLYLSAINSLIPLYVVFIYVYLALSIRLCRIVYHQTVWLSITRLSMDSVS